MSSVPDFLSDRDWRNLLREIHSGQVIPVIGPDLVTIAADGPATDAPPVPLHRYLAPQLAAALELDQPERFRGYNQVAREFLLNGGERKELYLELGELLDRLTIPPPPSLLSLASITDFNLFIASTPDPLTAHAVQKARPGFSLDRGVIRFHPAGNPNRSYEAPASGNIQSPCDLPETFQGPLVYHILGDYNTLPDFAVWEEDYMEFICGLIENRDTLENLFRVIANRNLLLLGAPSEDWIVRFFLRAARGKRLSDLKKKDYLADTHGNLGEPMIFFFDKGVKTTRIIDGNIHAFVDELARRWREQYGTINDGQTFLERQPEEMPRGSVFISYSRDDLSTAVQVAQCLSAAGVPVWLDKQRLQPGENYERSLEHTIKDSASFFLALISKATESDAKRYVHQERRWAAQKHVDGFVFYIPLIVDDLPDNRIRLEPECFQSIHRDRIDPDSLPRFAHRMRRYVDQYRDSGRPRG
jgi:hypothetical protein